MLALLSPLPWLPGCCRRHCRSRHYRCHCYGCHHLRRHQHHFCCHCYRFLVDCCLPLHCLSLGHHCLSLRLPLLAADAIATVVAAANRCPRLLPPQPRDVQNIRFKVIFEHLCCHLLVDCCLSLCWLCFCHCCLSPPLCVRQPFHRCHDKRRQHRELPVLDDNGRVKVEVQNITFTKETFWTSNVD